MSSGFEAYVYHCRLIEDIDGAPTCYGWDNPNNPLQQNLNPLEGHRSHQFRGLANAADPWTAFLHHGNFSWTSLYVARTDDHRVPAAVRDALDTRPELRDRHNRYPIVQQRRGHPAAGPAPGYYVSMSATAANGNLSDWDQNKYWNAAAIPYAVYANLDWPGTAVAVGDTGLVVRNSTGRHGEFFFADTRHLGVSECSYKVVRDLVGGPPREDPVSFLVFPGTRADPAIGSSGTMLCATITRHLAELTKVTNASDLILFLSIAADLDRLQGFQAGKDSAGQATVEASDEYQRVRRALFTDWGFLPP
jgi:hypothetical protein